MHESKSSDDPSGVTVIFGGPGTGKSHLLREVLRQYGEHGPTLTLDITGDMRAGLKGTLPRGHRIVCVSSVEDYKKAITGGIFSGFPGWRAREHLFVLPSSKQPHIQPCVDLFLWLSTDPKARRQWVLACCDESEQLFDGSNRPSREFRDALLVARNEHRAMIYATKRPTAIAPVIRSAARRACVFKVASDDDARACESLGPSVLFRSRGRGVQYLERGSYLYYSAAEHTPSDTLPLLSADDENLPWMENADSYFRKVRK